MDDFGALQDVLEAQEQAQLNATGGGDTYTHEVYGLIPDEVIIIRFVGGAGEPHKMHFHTLSPMGGNQFGDRHLCLGPGCIGCQRAVKGEQRITRASLWVAFSVYSTRPMWLIPTMKQDKTGTFNKREPLRRNSDGYPIQYVKGSPGSVFYPNHQHPLAGHQFEDEGIKVWKGSAAPKAANAASIMSLIADLKTRCQCGKISGGGMSTAPARVQPHSYTCGQCGQPCGAPVQGQSMVCMACHQTMTPDEHLVCTANCGQPARASLRNCYVVVKRTGIETKTAYSFTAMPFSQPEQAHAAKLYRQENNVWVPNSLPLAEIYKPNEAMLRQAMVARGIIDANAQIQVPSTLPGAMPGMGLPGAVSPAQLNPFAAAPQQAAPSPVAAPQPTVGLPAWGQSGFSGAIPHATPAPAAPFQPQVMPIAAPMPFPLPAPGPVASPVAPPFGALGGGVPQPVPGPPGSVNFPKMPFKGL